MGTVFACGRNDYGQLGNGTSTATNYIVQVSGLTNISAVAAGVYHSLALSNGYVYSWGETNAELWTNVPVRMNGLSNVIAVAGGRAFSIALDVQGKVWTWGDNEFGQLGQTNTFLGLVSGLTNIVAISAGVYHAFAIENNGQVWGWGRNDLGQLDASGINRATPITITNAAGALSISAGAAHNLVLTDGEGLSWGLNAFGQLGNGTTSDSTSSQPFIGTPGISTNISFLNLFTPLE
jgi:alpha-tubulin suppressor-like RCC1 family protein